MKLYVIGWHIDSYSLYTNFTAINKVWNIIIWGWGIQKGLNGWGSCGKVSYCFWEIHSKSTGLPGSNLSSYCMITGVLELLTHGYYSAMNIQITKQIEGGAEWMELS